MWSGEHSAQNNLNCSLYESRRGSLRFCQFNHRRKDVGNRLALQARPPALTCCSGLHVFVDGAEGREQCISQCITERDAEESNRGCKLWYYKGHFDLWGGQPDRHKLRFAWHAAEVTSGLRLAMRTIRCCWDLEVERGREPPSSPHERREQETHKIQVVASGGSYFMSWYSYFLRWLCVCVSLHVLSLVNGMEQTEEGWETIEAERTIIQWILNVPLTEQLV